jgi:hypothetical protein
MIEKIVVVVVVVVVVIVHFNYDNERAGKRGKQKEQIAPFFKF